ncbi:MAG: lysozyme, partial [Planctomycetaceae bacterium]|nr:lysozyme [Planctomycetaceae bacterium]
DQKAEAAVKKETDLLAKTAKGVFGDDLKPFEETVNSQVTGLQLTQGEFDSLVSFTFNLGSANFKSSTLLRKINEGKFRNGDTKQREKAIARIDSEFKRWNKSGGKVLAGLT